MMSSGGEQNEWKVQPDDTIQVVDHPGIKEEKDEEKKDWKGICISLSIIAFVLLMVIVAVLVLGPMQKALFHGRRITMKDFEDPNLVTAPMKMQWLSNDHLAYMTENEGIRILDLKRDNNYTLVVNSALKQTRASDFSVSPNQRYVLLTHNSIKGYLYSKTSQYSIYDIETDHYLPLRLQRQHVAHPRYQYATWAGIEKGVALIVVDQGDVYYLSSPDASPLAITKSAEPYAVLNGVPDTLYEEVLGQGHTIWPSPTGSYIAVASFNDTGVKILPVLDYSNYAYPAVHNMRYPTVDTAIPVAEVWIYTISGQFPPPRILLRPPHPIAGNPHYIIGVGWITKTSLWLSWLSRDQSTVLLTVCSSPTWSCKQVFVNHEEGAVSPTINNAVWMNSWAVLPWPVKSAHGRWRNQMVLVDSGSERRRFLKLGEYQASKVLGGSKDQSVIFFLGSKLPMDISYQQMYSVSTTDSSVKCLSCHLDCSWVTATLNGNSDFAAVTCLGFENPSSHVLSLADDQNISRVIHDQPSFRSAISNIALPVFLTKDIEIEEPAAYRASITFALPPGWSKKDRTLLYPLVLRIIGPRETALTDDLWQLGWDDYLPSSHQVTHGTLQLWGSDPSAPSSTHTLAQNCVSLVNKLFSHYDFLDQKNVGVWGRGSGASIAMEMAALAPKTFACVAAVNPITNWRVHGSFWAERQMGSELTPGVGRRFEDSDLRRLTPAYDSGSVMLAQGTQGPTAHQSFGLAKALTSNNIHFKHVVYADESYLLDSVRLHLLSSFEEFFFSRLHDPMKKEKESQQ